MKIDIHDNMTAHIAQILGKASTSGAEILANEIMKDSSPYVPALTGSLDRSAYTVGNKIIYPGPYARYLWYGKRMVNAKTGKGPRYIPNVGYRWPKGAVLVPTGTDLVFTHGMHQNAQSHWIEGAKAQKMQKWEGIAARIVTDGQ